MQKPEKGFYRHYKHSPERGINDYTYEVMGVARHSEDASFLVIYRPLYQNTYLADVDFSARPLDMFLETIEKEGKTMPRFERITDESLVAELVKIRDEMYRI